MTKYIIFQIWQGKKYQYGIKFNDLKSAQREAEALKNADRLTGEYSTDYITEKE